MTQQARKDLMMLQRRVTLAKYNVELAKEALLIVPNSKDPRHVEFSKKVIEAEKAYSKAKADFDHAFDEAQGDTQQATQARY